jgi:NADPH:quinone reductase-like Zn-dependent oxidoreductase
MKAVVYRKYGTPDVLRLEDIPTPVPKDQEILIRVRAVSFNAYDLHFVSASPFFLRLMGAGLLRPKTVPIGADMAGTVEAVGPGVESFKPGDEVYGCNRGSLAEFACGPVNRFGPKPVNLSFEEAAAVPMAAVTALQGLRDKGRIQKGQRVLVNGASGGCGSFAVQLAKLFGTEVTGVCRTSKMDFVRGLGADVVRDYTREDVTEVERPFDLIFDVAAFRPILRYRRILKPGGYYVLAGGSISRLLQLSAVEKIGGGHMMTMMTNENREDLTILKDHLESGRIRSFVDRRFPMAEAADALWYLKNGRVCGKVVVTVP